MESQNQNTKNALCYIPFVAIIIFFTENQKSPELMKHVKYGIFLFIIYILLQAIIGIFLWWLLVLFYLWISAFLFYKAYNWEKVELEHIDKLEGKIKEQFWSQEEQDNKKQ